MKEWWFYGDWATGISGRPVQSGLDFICRFLLSTLVPIGAQFQNTAEFRLFAGTAGIFFAVVNAVKLVPYAMLGQFDGNNLLASLVLVPLAPLGVSMGHYLVRRSSPGFYYRLISFFLSVLGIYLIYKGFQGVI